MEKQILQIESIQASEVLINWKTQFWRYVKTKRVKPTKTHRNL